MDFMRALLAYAGSKRDLCSLIYGLLAQHVPRNRWSDLTLVDPMCGGGAVALAGKAHGFRVIASDLALRAVIGARALVANSIEQISFAHVARLCAVSSCHASFGIAATFAPRVFSVSDASWIDGALAHVAWRPEPLRSLLTLLIVKAALRAKPMSLINATDAQYANIGDYDRISPRRLAHYLRARDQFTPERLWTLAQEVNAGVFGGRGRALLGDARSILPSITADVAYLDPPYAGTMQYATAYSVIDRLLGDDALRQSPPTVDELLDAARHIGIVVLSNGGPTMTLDALVKQVRRHRPVLRAFAVPYRHLGAIASVEKNNTNTELLLIAGWPSTTPKG